jgi:hypothetical protein
MATNADADSVTVTFDPTVNSVQADVIQGATPLTAGVMTAAQAAKLAGIPFVGAIGAFQFTVSQPADGTDFVVTLPPGLHQPDVFYMVSMTIASLTSPTGYVIPFVDQALTHFRVVTDGTFPDLTLLNFQITHF